MRIIRKTESEENNGILNKRLTLRSHEAKTYEKQGVSRGEGKQNALFQIAAKQYFGHLMILGVGGKEYLGSLGEQNLGHLVFDT